MKDNYIKLLKKRIEHLDNPEFDLEAWKGGTISVIERIFGETDGSIRKINDLKIDYSSWALRDATSKYNPMETCKKKGREILGTLIEEIDLMGVEKKGPATTKTSLEGLSKKTVAELKNLISDGDEAAILKLLKSEKKDSLAGVLARTLVAK